MPDSTYRLAVHGLAVQVRCDVPSIANALAHYLNDFAVPAWPTGFAPATGAIRAFDQREVLKCLSPSARRVASTPDFLELYEENERYWIIDERFGICEINLLKNCWRTWLLPTASRDPVLATHFAALWPMAQVLRGKGLHLLPASAISRGGISCLILSPFSLGPELNALVRAGWRLIGQSWSAARIENERIELLHVPGYVQRPAAPYRIAQKTGTPREPSIAWTDLTRDYCGVEQRYGFATHAIIVQPGRRPTSALTPITPARATVALRAAWPITELHPNRRHAPLIPALAQLCACHEAALTRNPRDFLESLTALSTSAPTRRAAAVA